MTFKDLGLIEPILRALKDEGYTTPTPIQKQSIPILLQGSDLLGCAQTGTGKTAAFSAPILQNLFQDSGKNRGSSRIRALVVTPTRELAIQINDSFSTYGRFTRLKNSVVFGGVKQAAQTRTLRQGIDILVATPGRLLDLIQQGYISLKYIEYFVLDEADRMLDMGFIHDIRKIIAMLPQKRQSMFFSATMSPTVIALSRKILGNPQSVSVKPEQTTAEKVDQYVYFVSKASKPKLLTHLLKNEYSGSTLIFSRTKYGADKISRLLNKAAIKSEAIHSNKSQGARQRALGNFKKGATMVLVATDIAARGIDIDDLSMVVNYDLPNIPESYVHRIGRTGRAEASGIAISFCNEEERVYLSDIQKLIGFKIAVIEKHPFISDSQEEKGGKPLANVQQSQNRPVHTSRDRKRTNNHRSYQRQGR